MLATSETSMVGAESFMLGLRQPAGSLAMHTAVSPFRFIRGTVLFRPEKYISAACAHKPFPVRVSGLRGARVTSILIAAVASNAGRLS